MRVRASQVLFIISAVLFITGRFFAAFGVFLIGFAVMMIESVPGPRRGDEEKEEKIIKPLE